jgi:tripartite-type tricarboxylate transporter receptor subunit TctC
MRFVLLPSLLTAIALAAIAPTGVHAQRLVTRPVRILVGFAPGGTTDTAARLLAETMKELLQEPVIVENKAGASGRIAAEALRSAAPDGATLLLVPIVVPVIAPLVFKQLNYDPAKDLVPVAHVANYQFAFAVGPSNPARTMAEFVAWAKSHPTQVSYGTPAAGSLPHFLGVMIGRAAGIEMVHVAYKGATPMTVDLMGGRIPAAVDALSDMIDAHRDGRLRIIATSGGQRSPLLPTVPTFKEQGFANVEGAGWIAMYAPARTPRSVIDYLSAAIVKALHTPELKDRLVNLGLEPTGTTPEELSAIMAADTAHWAPIIRASGFSAE